MSYSEKEEKNKKNIQTHKKNLFSVSKVPDIHQQLETWKGV